jgi:dipeptidase E
MKKGYIILSGGGDFKVSFKLDERYFSLLENGSKILYIPIALSRTKLGYEACYDWFSTIISGHSMKKDIDFTMLLENDIIPDFKKYDSIYMGGGNTYKLLDYIYRKNLGEKIVNFLNCGGIIYGGSAGAIVLGKDIRIVEEENDKNYPNFLGSNLLENKSVICHYEESLDSKIFLSAKKTGSQIIALPEDSGLILEPSGKIIEVIGNVYIFQEGIKKQI